jgi:ribosome maturation factor RimP
MRGSVSGGFRAHLFILRGDFMAKSLVTDRVREVAQTIAEETGVELVHVEDKGAGKERLLRVFIDREGGVTVEDCSGFSTRFGQWLDDEDLIHAEYILEVSSPGLERELYSLKDFVRFAGSLARLKTKRPLDGQKNFRGRLVSVAGEEITFDDRTRGIVTLSYADVLKANLEFDLDAELKGRNLE